MNDEMTEKKKKADATVSLVKKAEINIFPKTRLERTKRNMMITDLPPIGLFTLCHQFPVAAMIIVCIRGCLRARIVILKRKTIAVAIATAFVKGVANIAGLMKSV